MVKLKVLKPEELEGITKKPARTELVDYLKGIPEGHGGEIELEASDNSRSVRIQLRKAAKELGRTLLFRDIPGRKNMIIFQVHGIGEKK